MSDRADRPSSGVRALVDLLAFLGELALLAVLAVAGVDLTDRMWSRIGLSIALPVVAVMIWARWMAPKSSRRLPDPERLIAQIALFLVAGLLLALAGHRVWGAVFAVLAIAVFVATRGFDGLTGPGSVEPDAAETSTLSQPDG